jgi:uncharacterized protein (TIGR03086 family)
MSLDLLKRACVSTAMVLRAVEPEQMHWSTPLPEWDVHQLIDHIVSSASFFADIAEMGASPKDREWPDYAEGDFIEAFATESHRILTAFAAPGVMQTFMQLPIGPFPGSVCIFVATGEIFAHGWDLAKSTGQDTNLDAAVAEQLRNSVWSELCNDVRVLEDPPIGPEVAVPADASNADRLAGFLGRAP